MFKRTKRSIVFAVVGSLLALMAVALTTIFVSNHLALQRENKEILQTYVERYTPDDKPDTPEETGLPNWEPNTPPGEGTVPPIPPEDDRFRKNEPAFRLSTFYSVAYAQDGTVLEVRNGNENLQSEESLLELAATALQKDKRSGTVGSMSYLVEEKDGYTLVAMLDGTISNKNQLMLVRLMLIIGSATLAALVVISIFIARRIVRPLEENDKRQKRFVSDAGHELKTPIAVISANSELLRRQSGGSEWLDNIDYENERMSDLVKQLLILSHAENGDLPKEPLDLSQLVSGEVLPFESLAFENGKQIEAAIEENLAVEGNANQLRQLVSILLDNALSHGSGEEIALSLRREKHSAVLQVSNTAPEMTAAETARLFDRFYRTDEARNEAGAHYGLGLSIAKAVTEAHGGTIRAAYKDGKAIFTVTLPMNEKIMASRSRTER